MRRKGNGCSETERLYNLYSSFLQRIQKDALRPAAPNKEGAQRERREGLRCCPRKSCVFTRGRAPRELALAGARMRVLSRSIHLVVLDEPRFQSGCRCAAFRVNVGAANELGGRHLGCASANGIEKRLAALSGRRAVHMMSLAAYRATRPISHKPHMKHPAPSPSVWAPQSDPPIGHRASARLDEFAGDGSHTDAGGARRCVLLISPVLIARDICCTVASAMPSSSFS
jgi:hypothetical protein